MDDVFKDVLLERYGSTTKTVISEKQTNIKYDNFILFSQRSSVFTKGYYIHSIIIHNLRAQFCTNTSCQNLTVKFNNTK